MIEYGHATIKAGGRTFEFIPSFRNIDKIGSPEEIISYFLYVAERGYCMATYDISMHILDCCQETDEVLSLLFGEQVKSEWGVKIKRGIEEPRKAVLMAIHMLRHGICGPASDDNAGKREQLSEFHAVTYMNMARNYLGMSAQESGDLTMTEFVMLADMKKDEGRTTPNAKEHKDTMAWLADKNAKREELRKQREAQ